MSGAIALGDNATLAPVSAPAAGHYLLFYRNGVLTRMAPDGTETAVGGGGGSSPPFSDATALVKDDADATKLIRVDAGTVATGTTRVLTMPNADVNLGALATTQSVTDHLNDTLDAHDASAISYAGGTGMSATDVEAAIDELATEKQNVVTLYSIRDWAFQGTLTTATGVLRVPIHATGIITSIRAMVGAAPTGASIIIDVNKNGTTMYTTQGNRPTIAISGNAVNATLPDVTSLAAGDYLTVDIDQVGSTIAGANLVVSVRYSY